LLFDFVVFLTSFFSILPVYSCQKILQIFVLFLLYGSEILSKNSAKLWFFFKKFEIFDI